jgi:hypothetical protein
VKKKPFRPRDDNEELHLSAIGALMYLANNTRLDITFSMNLLAIYSSSPTWRHWDGVQHICRYLRGITYMCLFYSNNTNHELVGYVDIRYYLIHIKVNLKQVISLHVVILLYYRDLQGKH